MSKKKEKKIQFDTLSEVISAFKRGEMIIVTDDESRENEGDLVLAASKVTPDAINFMAKYGRGLICAPITMERAEELGLRKMSDESDPYKTAFTVSIDLKEGTTTGISAYDRAKTIAALVHPETSPDDFVSPGHVFPLIAKPGGVLQRAGHTEAAVDLAKLAGLYPAGVICEIMNNDGTMARLLDLNKFRKKHKLKWCSIADIIAFRRKNEILIKRIETVNMPTRYGIFKMHLYKSLIDDKEHIALVYGDPTDKEDVLVRVHSECLTGDVFHSLRCDCGEQLENAMQMIVENGLGIIVYMRQEGRGIGLVNKIHAYKLQEQGCDTVEANLKLGFPPDLREYGIGAQIIVDQKVKSVKLITNNPHKIVGINGYGFKVSGRVPIISKTHDFNKKYLEAKKKKLGHML
ncbi:MAG TPA: bifunctional 3,4-dihydroxy-2-butanone-4-phosphate synthase/GTP cyclohydrolase II [Victivallales bacterium]|nr:bifunctional 3,4-dihydroxy-2-butanone-4-phosphate synthase/GTP cyclohydrolase II [Victivallales bacterium]HPO91145.1 bifunctional 3,4-dihydroxy-2-butanone-4-phosphate synthase/GTP cyclohydrolase II [Victivallales bacterium]